MDTETTPSVLAVLVARNGAPWLRECLAGLSAQEYGRLGVLGVDCCSSDDSRAILNQSLGAERVLSTPGPGLPSAMKTAMEREAAREADYLLVLHDDAALAPDAVERMVEAAGTVDNLGAMGPKMVDWDNPRLLCDVGGSCDRFGHPYSPLEPGEMDQGQYDRIREVLVVSTAAMLISRAALARVGVPDERLGSHDEALDYCWRMRLAGLKVLMSPLSVARHREAAHRKERAGDRYADHRRYYEERAAAVAVLKNYGLGSIWVIPLFFVQGLVKLLALAVSRRFGEAVDLVAAWGWNIVHFPGTVSRRVKAQAVRAVKDREIHRYMTHGSVRLRRWLDAAGRIVPGDIELPEDEESIPVPPLRERASFVAREHPVVAAWITAIVVAAFAYPHLWGPEQIVGGGLPSVLPDARGYFTELVSGVRTTVLGGTQAGSPALAALGALSGACFGSTPLAEKLLLAVLPLLGGIAMYRAARRESGRAAVSLVAAGCYSLSAFSLWSFSTGRIPLLVMLAVLPGLVDRLGVAFGPVPPARRWRFMVGTGGFLAVAFVFYPGAAFALAVLALAFFVAPERAGRRFGGLGLFLGFALVGAALAFPLVVDLVRGGGTGLGSELGRPDIAALSRLTLVPGKGGWPVSWFLPAAAIMCFGLAGPQRSRGASRYLFAAVAGVLLAWASAAGYLPDEISDPSAYLAVAAVSDCALVAIGFASITSERPRHSLRRVVSELAVVVVSAGLALQALLAMAGSWDIGPGKLPGAWPLVAWQGEFRVLWIEKDVGLPVPAPGGDPQRLFEAGDDTFSYALTDGAGVDARDVGRIETGPGYDYLDRVLGELVSGRSRNAGAMLSPLGVRFVVAATGRIPDGVRRALDAQVDMDLVPAGGLVIYRNEVALPPAAVLSEQGYSEAKDLPSLLSLPEASEPVALVPVTGGWDGSGGGTVWIGEQYAPGWRLRSGVDAVPPGEAAGWAMTFRLPQDSGAFSVRYADQRVRTAEMGGLALLWLIALWATRKPSRR